MSDKSAKTSPLLQLKHVSKIYQLGEYKIKALDNIDFEIYPRDFIAIVGSSGSGKSTFLQIASNLAEASHGEVFLHGKNVTSISEVERAHLRNYEIGFIFQQFNLLARTPAWENVALPLLYAGVPAGERKTRAIAMLEKVGLGDRINNQPSQLSGGQQQRVAIARALINNPSLIFADEPTGNLDSKSSADIKKILYDLSCEGKTIIVVTHDENVAKITKRQITFKDGQIIHDTKRKVPRACSKK
jgi:putative ABC transport system ATP-binding protein